MAGHPEGAALETNQMIKHEPSDRTDVDRIAVGVEIVVGLGAVGGGALMMLAPDGHLLGMTTSQLSSTPFGDYVLPGIGLFTAIGLGMLLVATATLYRDRRAPLGALAVGCALIAMEVYEVIAIPFSVLQPVMFAAGLLIATWGIFNVASHHRSSWRNDVRG
jgi:hypothetical protein